MSELVVPGYTHVIMRSGYIQSMQFIIMLPVQWPQCTDNNYYYDYYNNYYNEKH